MVRANPGDQAWTRALVEHGPRQLPNLLIAREDEGMLQRIESEPISLDHVGPCEREEP